MLITATFEQQQAILGAMAQIATLKGQTSLTEVDRLTLTACDRYVFRSPQTLNIDTLPHVSLTQLPELLVGKELAEATIRFLTVMAFVDGAIDEAKIALVLESATTLKVNEAYLNDLRATAQNRLAWVIADMSRRNVESITGRSWLGQNVIDWLLPYRGAQAQPDLAARYQALRHLPEESLGRAFWQFYQQQSYPFPGEQNGLNQQFSTPHDATHILCGYDTTPQEEILVSAFTAGMHPYEPMAGHILPIIYSWHLGIKFNDVAKSATGALDPERFWQAWVAGSEMPIDLFSSDWDFWAAASETVDTLRQAYGLRSPFPVEMMQ